VDPQAFTELLCKARSDDALTIRSLTPTLYKELRRLAASYLRRRKPGESIQPTDLVHEAYLRMVDGARVRLEDRAHFLKLAATVMRRVLVDRARRKAAVKHGGGLAKVPLPPWELADTVNFSDSRFARLVALDEALRNLASHDERKAEAIELRYFGGLSIEETAQVVGVSVATVGREIRHGEAWLRRELAGAGRKK